MYIAINFPLIIMLLHLISFSVLCFCFHLNIFYSFSWFLWSKEYLGICCLISMYLLIFQIFFCYWCLVSFRFCGWRIYCVWSHFKCVVGGLTYGLYTGECSMYALRKKVVVFCFLWVFCSYLLDLVSFIVFKSRFLIGLYLVLSVAGKWGTEVSLVFVLVCCLVLLSIL